MLIRLFFSLFVILAILLGVLWVDNHSGFLSVEILSQHIKMRTSVAILILITLILAIQLVFTIISRLIGFRNSVISWISPHSTAKKIQKLENCVIALANGEHNKIEKILRYFREYGSMPNFIEALEFHYAKIAKIETRKNLMIKFINNDLFKKQALLCLIEIFEAEQNHHLISYYSQEYLKVHFCKNVFFKLIQHYIDNKQWKDALAIVREARLEGNIEPNVLNELQANLFYLIAQKAYFVENYKKAKKYCSLSLEVAPNYLHSMTLSLLIALQNNDNDSASKTVKQFLNASKDFSIVKVYLDYMLSLKNKDFVKILGSIGIKQNTSDEQTLLAFAYANILEKNFKKAKEYLETTGINWTSQWHGIFMSLISMHDNNLSDSIKNLYGTMHALEHKYILQPFNVETTSNNKSSAKSFIKFELPMYL